MHSWRAGGAAVLAAATLGWTAGDERSPAPASARAFDPAKCVALVVGVLEWQNSDSGGFAPFAKEDRQDALLAQTLIELGVPADALTLLLDEQATLAAVETKLAEIAGAAASDATLLFYYAGHGTQSGPGGCFVPYDMEGGGGPGDGDVDEEHERVGGIALDRVAEILEDRFGGERVLLFADCCFSGQLARVVDRLGDAGFEAECVTSVVPESSSTGNWTFTQTLIEAFRGDPSLDRNGDARIDHAELEQAVRQAMAWRASQRSAARQVGMKPEFVLAPVVPTAAATRFRAAVRDVTAPFALGDHVRVEDVEEAEGDDRRERVARVARVVGLEEDGQLLVRSYAYATHTDDARAADQLEAVSAQTRPVDTIVGVRRGPDRIAGRVVEVDAPFHRVCFPAWPELEGEWMVASRFRDVPEPDDVARTAARACMVEWRGRWYPALTLGEAEAPWKVHYVGFGADWDESVGRDRIRFTSN